MSEREALAEAIREGLRDHLALRVDESEIAADAVLNSEALARLLADAEQRGAARVREAVEGLADEWERAGFEMESGQLRAALATGAAERVRAEEGER